MNRGKPFAAVLYTAAKHAALDWRDKMANREKSIPPTLAETAVEEPKPIWLDAKRIVDQCLRGLARQEDRLILKMHFEGYNFKEIQDTVFPHQSEVEPSIYTQKETALRRLKKCIEGHGVRLDDLLSSGT